MDRSGSRQISGASSISSSPQIPRFNRNNTSEAKVPISNLNNDHNNVLLYIDNSNIFESARKHSARKKGYLRGIIDVACRIDIGKLLTKALGNRVLLFGKLYGSEPPALDSVWEAIRKKHVQVKTFERSKWTLKEKETDSNLTADAVEDIVMNRDVPGENTVIIFSGDRDLLCVVQKAFYHGYRVEIWSFRSAINNAVRRAAEENQDKIQIYYIDDIFSEVTFTCMAWGQLKVPRERSLVATVKIPASWDKRQIFKDFVVKAGEVFKLPMMGKYIDNHQHILLVPCVKEVYTPPVSQSRPKQEGSGDRKYSFYTHIQPFIPDLQRHFQEFCTAIIPWNEFLANRGESENENILASTRFQLLQINDESEDEDQEEVVDFTEIGNRVMLDIDTDFYDLHNEGITDDFIPIVPKAKRKGHLYSEPCCHKFACCAGTKCDYKHTDEEKEFFKTMSNPKQRFLYKTKACCHAQCKFSNKPYLCVYAHNLKESRCLCCKQQGNGQHWMDECPEIVKNTN